jgi:peroxiredoxin
MIAEGTPPNTARNVTDHLLSMEIPPVLLAGGWERTLNLGDFMSQSPTVVYFYAGCGNSPGDGEETALMDARLHRAFRDHQPSLEARHYRVVGISSQSHEAQRQSALANRLAGAQLLLCDPELQLARDLALPTFTRHRSCWYQRLVLVVSKGRIEKVFFPVPNPSRGAAQVLAWMLLRGCQMGGYDDAG